MATAFLIGHLERLSRPPCAQDIAVLNYLDRVRKQWLNVILWVISLLGSIYFLAPFTLLILKQLIQSGQFADARYLATSLFGVCIIANVAKWTLKRPRPNLFHPFGVRPKDPSFPSAHSAQILTFTVSVLDLLHITSSSQSYAFAIAGFWIIALVCFSRVYLQMHYLSDIAAGIILGCGWLLAVNLLVRK